MAVAYTHMPMDQRISDFGFQRIHELGEVIKNAQNEIEMWRAISDQQGLCKSCGGEKKVRYHISHDETGWEVCPGCKGTGKR